MPGPSEFLDEFLCDIPKDGGLRGTRIRHDDRMTGVAAVPNGWIDGNASEKRHAKLFGRALAASIRKNLRSFAAMAADKVTHVLHDPQQRDIHFLEHGHALANVVER